MFSVLNFEVSPCILGYGLEPVWLHSSLILLTFDLLIIFLFWQMSLWPYTNVKLWYHEPVISPTICTTHSFAYSHILSVLFWPLHNLWGTSAEIWDATRMFYFVLGHGSRYWWWGHLQHVFTSRSIPLFLLLLTLILPMTPSPHLVISTKKSTEISWDEKFVSMWNWCN